MVITNVKQRLEELAAKNFSNAVEEAIRLYKVSAERQHFENVWNAIENTYINESLALPINGVVVYDFEKWTDVIRNLFCVEPHLLDFPANLDSIIELCNQTKVGKSAVLETGTAKYLCADIDIEAALQYLVGYMYCKIGMLDAQRAANAVMAIIGFCMRKGIEIWLPTKESVDRLSALSGTSTFDVDDIWETGILIINHNKIADGHWSIWFRMLSGYNGHRVVQGANPTFTGICNSVMNKCSADLHPMKERTISSAEDKFFDRNAKGAICTLAGFMLVNKEHYNPCTVYTQLSNMLWLLKNKKVEVTEPRHPEDKELPRILKDEGTTHYYERLGSIIFGTKND